MSKRWRRIYAERDDIEASWYESLLQEVTVEEWDSAMSKAKSKSAPGLSGISYPILKQAGIKARKVFAKIASACIKKGEIPKKWKAEMLYPIPKSEEWNYNLNNIRPIVLIEVFRKCTVRILTIRLSKILKEKEILKGYNFAGLPGEGTASPIHIINNIIEDAKEKNNELWIVLQDIHKAFDSVSNEMLKLALKRIKIPATIVKFIAQLYEKREIEVITSVGNTDRFQAVDGIDQGEVISPLVWRIFYDPLLVAVQEEKDLGYKMKVSWPSDITSLSYKNFSWRQTAIAYADDTVWLAKSKSEMEKIISIAEEFFKINDIKINGKKSELIVINRRRNTNAPEEDAQIAIAGVAVKAKRKTEATRYLGIWISEKSGKECKTEVARKEIAQLTKAIKKKKMSLGQLVYINNKVLIPRLEYRLQCCLMPQNMCKKIHRPMLMLIKSKANLASTITDGTLTHKNLTGVRTLWQSQVAHHFTELATRLNDRDAVGQTTWLRLRQSQLNCKSIKSILELQKEELDKFKICGNLAFNIVKAAKSLKLEFRSSEMSDELRISKEGLVITSMLEKQALHSFCKDQKLNLFVVEQLLNMQGDKMLTWKQVKKLRGVCCKGKKASWFSKLEKTILYNADTNDRAVKTAFKKEGANPLCIRAELSLISEDRRRKEWVVWSSNNANRDLYLARIMRKKSPNKSFVMQHWKKTISQNSLEILIKCQGCELATVESPNECVLEKQFKNKRRVVKDSILKKNKDKNGVISFELEVNSAQLAPTGGRIASNEEMQLQQAEPTIVVETHEDEYITRNISSIVVQRQLKEILNRTRGGKRLEIFTDGSLVKDRSSIEKVDMGIGWVISKIDGEETNIEFCGKINDWPSSTRAELGAIWTALAASPINAEVVIYTDSTCAIKAIRKTQDLTKPREELKLMNGSITSQIVSCCRKKNLKLILIKVKGHSGIKHNEQADKLAKKGVRSKYGIAATGSWANKISVYPYWNGHLIDRPLREFIDIVTTTVLDTEWALSSKIREITSTERESDKSWKEAWAIIYEMKGSRCNSLKKSRDWVFRIKCMNKLLPTKDLLYRRSPSLYKDDRCIACFKETETQDHIATCEIYENIWLKAETEVAETILSKIKEKKNIKSQDKQIWQNALFGTQKNDKHLARKCLIRGIISQEISNRITIELSDKTKTENTIKLLLVKFFWKAFFERIWCFRCEVINEWETRNQITAQQKKGKRKENDTREEEMIERSRKKRKKDTNMEEASNNSARDKEKEEKTKKKRKVLEWAEEVIEEFVTNYIKPVWSSLFKPRPPPRNFK